ncbi:hypothetical protein, partial [Mycobacterium marinum]|uniref:hypothetical protein n=1 Tax=Mycobacterium marinum TaxID=1781 RepID=UPI0021C28979
MIESSRDLSTFSDSSWIAAIAASLKSARNDPMGADERICDSSLGGLIGRLGHDGFEFDGG